MPEGKQRDLFLCHLFLRYENACQVTAYGWQMGYKSLDRDSGNSEYWIGFYNHYAQLYHKMYVGMRNEMFKKEK